VATALVARDVSRSYGDQVVLDGVDLVAGPGLPLGLVGENGVGKSTLLRLLAGVEPVDAGSVVRPDELGYLAQEPAFPDRATVQDVLDEALLPLHEGVARLAELASRLEDPGAQDEYAALLDWSLLHDAWGADRRAALAAERLGIGGIGPSTSVSTLSGGQRSRLALAALMARRPACVLLDEPTNHLDDGGVELLEDFLVRLSGVVVVASHDRTFLENVCSQIVDLDPSHFGTDGEGGNRFTGGYADYLAGKERARSRWEQSFLAQRDELDDLRATLGTSVRRVAHNRPPRDGDKFIYHAKGENVARTVSRRVRDIEKRIATLEAHQIPKPARLISFRGELTSGAAAGVVVTIRDLHVRGRVHVPHLDVRTGEHVLVTGPNGSGKSTLLKVLAGVLTPDAGTAAVAARQVGYLAQDVTFRRPDLTPLQVYDGLTGSPVPLAELGLLHPRELNRPVGLLSIGQQRRLALAVLVAREADMLLLDEPTNHISLALADELEHALQRSAGAVLVASHDRWLRRRWQGSTLSLSSCAG